MSRAEPTMFTTVAALEALDVQRDGTELWIDAPRDVALAELDALAVDYLEVRNGATVADGLSFLTVSWTFGYVTALGVLAGLLAVAGAAVYLDARRRDRVLGYTFARRMGMTPRRHRRALLLELGASVTVGCWVGLVAATVAVWIAHGHIDPIPVYEPAPLFRPATGVLVGVGTLAVVVAVVGAVLAQRRVDRDDPVEVLRAGA
jgi:putative ABC transport system permease protein